MAKKVTIEVLMDDPGGGFVFKPIEVTLGEVKKLTEAAKNPVIKYNLEIAAKEKKVKL